MSEDSPQFELLYSDEFKARLRSLAKRYRKIQADLKPLLEDLKSGTFEGVDLGLSETIDCLGQGIIRFSKFGSKIVIFGRERVRDIV
jgi:hypothetical protein